MCGRFVLRHARCHQRNGPLHSHWHGERRRTYCKAGLISERSKAGLAQSKKKLGRTGAEILAPKYHAEAKARAERLAPVLRHFQSKVIRCVAWPMS
jgi:hypothetical protein